ncbi:MAG: hypothetical protein HZB51_15580 [Chloroflexi bacterium]|nr:hypothetical protein [Chloroflexota bacterium]
MPTTIVMFFILTPFLFVFSVAIALNANERGEENFDSGKIIGQSFPTSYPFARILDHAKWRGALCAKWRLYESFMSAILCPMRQNEILKGVPYVFFRQTCSAWQHVRSHFTLGDSGYRV